MGKQRKPLPTDFLENAPLYFRLKAQLRKSPLASLSYQRRWRKLGDVILLSYPKAGRTWLRLMMGKAMALHYGLSDADLIELEQMGQNHQQIPRIKAKHDENPHLLTSNELVQNKSEHKHVRVLFLTRDFRDLAVSNFFEFKKRRNQIHLDLHQYIHMPRGGVQTMVDFHNIWAQNTHQPIDFTVIRYEDLHTDTENQLKRALTFSGVKDVSDEHINQAVNFSRFGNMRKHEQQGTLGNRLTATNPKDKESYKTRKGKIGGYSEYMSEQDANWIADKMRNELDPMYGYPYASEHNNKASA